MRTPVLRVGHRFLSKDDLALPRLHAGPDGAGRPTIR
jgi:hypothetical protein